MKHSLETYLSHHLTVCASCDEVAETGCEYCSACLATVAGISDRLENLGDIARDSVAAIQYAIQ